MKLIIITQSYSKVVETLSKSDHQLVAIIEASPRGYINTHYLKKIKNKIAIFLSNTLSSQDSLKEFCRRVDIFYRFMISSDDVGLEEWIRKISPDLIVVYGMSCLLKKKIFEIPKYGTINLHPSYLPKYRGPNPVFWQYYFMDMSPGVTVHYINEGEDTGDIIFQEKFPIDLGIKSSELTKKMIEDVGVRILIKAINAIEKGSAPRLKQPKESPTPRSRLLKIEEHQKIIDWVNWPIERIWHVMRGTESWLNCIEHPHRWIVDNYQKCSEIQDPKLIGKIKKNKKEFAVVCGDGFIKIQKKEKKIIKLFKYLFKKMSCMLRYGK